MDNKKILDACCGSRMFWFNKENKNTVYMDNRTEETTLCDGRKLIIKPDIIADFRKMPYKDETFHLVIFDPPHLLRAGEYTNDTRKVICGDWECEEKQRFELRRENYKKGKEK